MKETLRGPDGLIIELDSDQIFPDDPGQGTPALVVQRKNGRDYMTGTFRCVSDQGTLEGDRGEFLVLNKAKCAWLLAQEEVVDEFITRHTRAIRAAEVKPVTSAQHAVN